MAGDTREIFRKARQEIQNPATLERPIVDPIGAERWSALEADVKGDIHEGRPAKSAAELPRARASILRRAPLTLPPRTIWFSSTSTVGEPTSRASSSTTRTSTSTADPAATTVALIPWLNWDGENELELKPYYDEPMDIDKVELRYYRPDQL